MFHVQPTNKWRSSPRVYPAEKSTIQKNCTPPAEGSTWNERRSRLGRFQRLKSCGDLTDLQRHLFHVEHPRGDSASSQERFMADRKIQRAGTVLQSVIGPMLRFD